MTGRHEITVGPDGRHTGPVQVRWHRGWVGILCPLGHTVTGASTGPDWGGSWLEAKIGAHFGGSPWVVTCDGALPATATNGGAR